jgi:hypothetical protein
VATNFAAPNLRMLGLNSFGFNFSGTTSGGKTLLLRMAASGSGLNSGAGPATWDGTPSAFEQRALGHRDCIMPLDDISHLEGDSRNVSKLATFRLAGNQAKQRAGQYVVAQDLVEEDWRVISLSTSEVPLWEHLNGHGARRRIRGEEVRIFDVPACVSDMQDIFDGKYAHVKIGGTVQQRRRFAEHQERITRKYQGQALRAYLKERACDKRAKVTLKRHMKEYTRNAPLPEEERWLERIQRLFAAIYASAAQAIEYGVLPWQKTGTLSAIRACMRDAMAQLIANVAKGSERGRESVESHQSTFAEFKRRLDEATFVRLERNRRKKVSVTRLNAADGVIRPTKPGRCECCLFARTLNAWYPQHLARHRLTKLLRSHRILKQGRRADTNTRQVFIAELDTKIPCYGLVRKRLKDIVGKL